MGRAPCCDKANVKKGPWSPEEDAKLKAYIEKHGTGGNWIALPQKIGLKRCGKSCRLRWLNYLRPNIKHGGFSEEEDNIICSLYISIGSRWSIIAAQLPGRTDNDIKNYWNTRLKKKLLGKQRKEIQARGRINVNNNSKQNQEMKRGRDNSNDNLQNPYFPALPAAVLSPAVPLIPYSNGDHEEESRFNDHASIRKLLIKLGGRFSSDDGDQQTSNSTTLENLQYHHPPQLAAGTSSSSLVQPLYPLQQLNQLSDSSNNNTAATAAEVLINSCFCTNLPDMEYRMLMVDHASADQDNMSMLSSSAQSEFTSELEKLIYKNPGQKYDGLQEFLCGGDHDIMMMNNNNRTNNGTITNWGEMMSSLLLPSITTTTVAPNYESQQATLHDHHLRYPGARQC